MDLTPLLRAEAERRLLESLARIETCVDRLNDEQLWHRPNQNVVSVGNLILHLTGNVGQWINSTMGKHPDIRQRSAEFNTEGPLDRIAMMDRARRTVEEAVHIIRRSSPEDLARTWSVQGFKESGLAIVLHVVEHFSYHTGQIALHTKLLLNVDTGFYAGQDLEAKG